MLDNEPDNHTQESPEQPVAPVVRRRRAASRPAGPPSSAPDAPPIEHSAPVDEPVPAERLLRRPVAEASVEPELPLKKTAKKAAAKRPAKKAVAKKTAESADSAGAKPPRKRAAKKVAPAAEEPVDEVLSDVAVALEALTETVAEHAEPASEEPPSGGARA